MSVNPKYQESSSYNKHLSCDPEQNQSPCPPGLVAVLDCDGNHVGCLSPNDAEVYRNATLAPAEGYTKVYHPTTGEFLGAMSVDDACKLLDCVNGEAHESDFVVVYPLLDGSGLFNLADLAADGESEDFNIQLDRVNNFKDVTATLISSDGLFFSGGVEEIVLPKGISIKTTNLDWDPGITAGTYLFKVSLTDGESTKEINGKIVLS